MPACSASENALRLTPVPVEVVPSSWTALMR